MENNKYFRGFPGEIYFENSSKYYLKSSLNKLRIALHSMLRKDFVVFSKSQNHLGSPLLSLSFIFAHPCFGGFGFLSINLIFQRLSSSSMDHLK
jgi:hypothetical protein